MTLDVAPKPSLKGKKAQRAANEPRAVVEYATSMHTVDELPEWASDKAGWKGSIYHVLGSGRFCIRSDFEDRAQYIVVEIDPTAEVAASPYKFKVADTNWAGDAQNVPWHEFDETLSAW